MKKGLIALIGVVVIVVAILGYVLYSNYNALIPTIVSESGSSESGSGSGTNPTTDTSTTDTSTTLSESGSSESGSGSGTNPTTDTSTTGSGSGSSGSSESGSGTGTSPAAGPAVVNLGTAGNFVILSKSGISTTGTTSIVGDIGVSPIDSTAITGFGLVADSSNTFSTSSLVTGKVYAADYTPPTPATMTTAVSDMETAYTDAAGRTNPTATELGAGDISGMTLTPGLYKWGTVVLINNGVTLSCQNVDDVFIFQIGQDLTVGNGAVVTLAGGCQPKNIFWQVAGQATLGTTSQFKGNILSQTLIEMNTGATLNGRALAQTAVTLDANSVTKVT